MEPGTYVCWMSITCFSSGFLAGWILYCKKAAPPSVVNFSWTESRTILISSPCPSISISLPAQFHLSDDAQGSNFSSNLHKHHIRLPSHTSPSDANRTYNLTGITGLRHCNQASKFTQFSSKFTSKTQHIQFWSPSLTLHLSHSTPNPKLPAQFQTCVTMLEDQISGPTFRDTTFAYQATPKIAPAKWGLGHCNQASILTQNNQNLVFHNRPLPNTPAKRDWEIKI